MRVTPVVRSNPFYRKDEFMKKFDRILALILSLSMTAGCAVQSVGASAGEDPPPITSKDMPDPSSFSYDDVEVRRIRHVLACYRRRILTG